MFVEIKLIYVIKQITEILIKMMKEKDKRAKIIYN